MTDPVVETSRGPVAMPLRIREPRASDQGYVTSSWVASLAMADHTANKAAIGHIVDRLLDHPNVLALLACDPTKPDRIYGWIVWSPMPSIRLVHYVYVRNGERDRGIASALRLAAGLANADRPLVFTMRGPCYTSLARKYHNAIEQPVREFLS